VLLSPQGSGSGGGATPAGSTADIQFNSGGLLAADTGKFTYTAATGTLSTTTVSATRINVAPSVSTVVSLNGGSGNMISSGSAVVSTSSTGSVTIFSGGAAQMLVGSGGVGIGNLTPNAPLVVQKDSTDYTRLRLRNTNAAGGTGYYFGTDADNDYAAFIIANNTSNTAYSGANSLNFMNAKGAMSFSTATNGVFERMRIDTNGNMQLTTVSIALIVAALTMAFRRRGLAVLVLINLPFCLIGSIAVIVATGIGMTLGSLVGLITVFGIGARNSVMMLAHVEHVADEEERQWNGDTIRLAAAERLAPVFMTALMAALGLVPLALGLGRPSHEIEAPMAIAVLGGLTTATLLNLGVLPEALIRLGRYLGISIASTKPAIQEPAEKGLAAKHEKIDISS